MHKNSQSLNPSRLASTHTLMGKLCSCCRDRMVPRRQGTWSKDEDEQLMAYTKVHGVGRWHLIPQNSGLLRCGKSCRARWLYYLRPDLIGGDFTDREKELISELHGIFGNSWTKIAKRLPGRTSVEVRNYWKRTHKPKKAAANDHQDAQTSLGTVLENEELTAGFTFSNQLTTPNEEKFADLNLDLALSFPCQRQTPSASCSSGLITK